MIATRTTALDTELQKKGGWLRILTATMFLGLALLACAEDAEDAEEENTEKANTAEARFEAVKNAFGESGASDERRLRLLRAIALGLEDERFLAGAVDREALVEAMTSFLREELGEALVDHYRDLNFSDEGVLDKAKVLAWADELAKGDLLPEDDRGELAELVEEDTPYAFETLLRTYSEDAKARGFFSELARAEVAEAMGVLPYLSLKKGDKIANSVLKRTAKLMETDRSDRVKLGFMRGIGSMGTEEAAGVLWAFAEKASKKRDSFYLHNIADAMSGASLSGESGEEVLEVVKKRLGSKDAAARQAAAASLGAMKAEGAVGDLANLLKDRDPAVKKSVLDALGRIGTEAAERPLIDRLDDGDAHLRAAAARALGQMGSTTAVDRLSTILAGDDSPVVRAASAKALGRIGGEAATKALQSRAESDPSATVRHAIEAALGGGEPEVADEGEESEEADEDSPILLGVPIHSDRVVIMLDRANSMRWGKRLEKATAALEKAIGNLPDGTQFDVVAFASDTSAFSRGVKKRGPKVTLLPKAAELESQLGEWLGKITADGDTHTLGAFQFVFETYPEADTIILVSDGAPSSGKIVDEDRVLTELRKLNHLRQVRIHVVALLEGEPRTDSGDPPLITDDKEVAASFLRGIALDHDGRFELIVGDEELDDLLPPEELDRRAGKVVGLSEDDR